MIPSTWDPSIHPIPMVQLQCLISTRTQIDNQVLEHVYYNSSNIIKVTCSYNTVMVTLSCYSTLRKHVVRLTTEYTRQVVKP